MRLERKIGGSDENKDNINKKDLLAFYQKFQSLS